MISLMPTTVIAFSQTFFGTIIVYRMVFSPRSLIVLFIALSHLAVLSSAWSLADRVSGRAFPRQTQRYPTRRQAQTSVASSSNQNDQNNMLDSMEEPTESFVGDLSKKPNSVEQDELTDFVNCIVKAADGRKADDICALRVSHVTTLCSCLVILSGNSRPQNQAITAAIQNEVKDKFDRKPGGSGVPEGSADSGWMLLDYGDVMVHIMTPKSRLYYNVEGQWRDKGGEEMDISHILIPNKPPVANDLTGDDGFVAKEDDPFWS